MLCACNWLHDFSKVSNYDHPMNGEMGLEYLEGCLVLLRGSLLTVLYGCFKLLEYSEHSIKFLGRDSGTIGFMSVSFSFVRRESSSLSWKHENFGRSSGTRVSHSQKCYWQLCLPMGHCLADCPLVVTDRSPTHMLPVGHRGVTCDLQITSE